MSTPDSEVADGVMAHATAATNTARPMNCNAQPSISTSVPRCLARTPLWREAITKANASGGQPTAPGEAKVFFAEATLACRQRSIGHSPKTTSKAAAATDATAGTIPGYSGHGTGTRSRMKSHTGQWTRYSGKDMSARKRSNFHDRVRANTYGISAAKMNRYTNDCCGTPNLSYPRRDASVTA